MRAATIRAGGAGKSGESRKRRPQHDEQGEARHADERGRLREPAHAVAGKPGRRPGKAGEQMPAQPFGDGDEDGKAMMRDSPAAA